MLILPPGSLSDNQSIEIRLTEMLDSKMELRSDKKFGMESEMSLGPKQVSNLSNMSFSKSARNTSVAVFIDSPQVKIIARYIVDRLSLVIDIL